ncbi:hypothetical protein CAPTEDRAFT_228275 [Capitella teleta]|uniref:TIR domain-containing protein n=1 Tax=Capitella teleta TaxID=283909 RepID=R7URB0_CAPTE|nr:hypothetical protein CAPTEDRAFT_228275 [Capitella teleta]|eukprot:ELU08653.1 hypothetical protein CAPTEDRAFT_228275 [Capitella teleta]
MHREWNSKKTGKQTRHSLQALWKFDGWSVTLLRRLNRVHYADQPNGSNNQIFARDLPPHLQFHVVFISHSNDLQWLSKVIQKAQSPPYCFRCACLHQDSFSKSSLLRSVHHSLKSASKTVLVLTRDFIRDVWLLSDMQLLSEMHVILTNPNLVLLHTESCDIPKALSELCTIDTYNNLNWWSELLTQLCAAADSPETEVMSMSSSFASSKPNIQSGQLLLSVRSTCGSCGKEFVDPSDVPEELASHGIHIPADEYHSAVSHLMSDQKFLCHVWCYNVPAAIVFFGLLLCLCLSVIPLLEIHLSEHPTETGLEFVHGGIVWLCGLTVYMFIIQISKKKMKLNTYKRLSVVNSKLMKYNILTGLENLGLADCNKYYLHFFYIETGPCIEYLEELLMSLSEHNEERKTADNVNYVIEIEDDEKVCKSLVSGVITNATRQNQVGQLLLQHSGEYISLMITKKLQTPAKMRHLENGPCLCQHLEHKLYHMLAE